MNILNEELTKGVEVKMGLVQYENSETLAMSFTKGKMFLYLERNVRYGEYTYFVKYGQIAMEKRVYGKTINNKESFLTAYKIKWVKNTIEYFLSICEKSDRKNNQTKLENAALETGGKKQSDEMLYALLGSFADGVIFKNFHPETAWNAILKLAGYDLSKVVKNESEISMGLLNFEKKLKNGETLKCKFRNLGKVEFYWDIFTQSPNVGLI